jgi:predicted amidophosphoribosyltransferase
VRALDLLLPRSCVGCGEAHETLCRPCQDALHRILPPLCGRCGAPTAWPVARCAECAGRRISFAEARSAVIYDRTAKRVVAAWKERGLRRIAELAADVVADGLPRPEAHVLTFVAADRDRTLKRGYRPAQRLARALADRWELPVAPLLVRSGAAPPQRGLSLADRRRNVQGAFRAPGHVPARVVLVDDVYTTGSTANAAASALRRGGASQVRVITFARAVR